MSSMFVAPSAFGKLSREQTTKLLSAAWKTPPESMDIVYFVSQQDYTIDEQELRQRYKKIVEEMYGPLQSQTSNEKERRDQTVELNVQRILREQQVGRKVRFHVRYDDKGQQRLDKVEATPSRILLKGSDKEKFVAGKPLDPNTPYEYSIIDTIDNSGGFRRFELYHLNKTVQKREYNSSTSFSKFEGARFMMMPGGPSTILKIKTGDRHKEGGWDPNDIKIDRLCSDSLEGILVSIEPDKNNPDFKVKIEINICDKNQNPYLNNILICDKNDYSRVYSHEGIILETGQVITKETRSDFDSQGFPHHIVTIEYENTAKIKCLKTYEIESVQINNPIPDEIFDFNPPLNYKIITQE